MNETQQKELIVLIEHVAECRYRNDQISFQLTMMEIKNRLKAVTTEHQSGDQGQP